MIINWPVVKQPLNWLLVLAVLVMLCVIGHIYRDRSLED